MSKAADILRQAQQLAQAAPTWADLSNALYDPCEGLLARAYSTREERREFIRTEEYKQIQQLFAEARERHGLIEGATPTRITEFMVQLHLTSVEETAAGPGALFRAETRDPLPGGPPRTKLRASDGSGRPGVEEPQRSSPAKPRIPDTH